MNELKENAKRLQEIIDFAESKGWSEEDLSKVINLLHTELKDNNYFSLSTFDTKS